MGNRNKNTIVILAFALCLSLSACGRQSAVSSNAPAVALSPLEASSNADDQVWSDPNKPEDQEWRDPNKPEDQDWRDPNKPEDQEWRDPNKPEDQEWRDTENYEDQDWSDPENYAAQEWSDPYGPESEPYQPIFDWNQVSLAFARPMSEGIMWVQYMQDGQNLVSAVREDGTIVVTFDEVVKRAADFDQGVAFVSFIEGNVTWHQGHYELPYDKRNLTSYEIIIDADGNILYDTRYPAGGSGVSEEILCHGNGKFVVLRHESGMTVDRWTLGTIDSHGNTVDEFIEYGSTENRNNFKISFSLEDLSNNFSNISSNYLSGFDYDTDLHTASPRYRGEGWYIVGINSDRYLFYQPETQTLTNIISDYDPSPVNEGRVEAFHWSFVKCCDLYTGESHEIAETGMARPAYTDGLVYSKKAHAYLDFDGSPVIVLQDYPDLETTCGAFYGDYAVACLTGVDGNSYAGVIDRSGALQFEPIRVNEVRYTMDDGNFLAKDDDGWKMYDASGSVIHYYSWDVLSWICDGFALVRRNGAAFSELAYLYVDA